MGTKPKFRSPSTDTCVVCRVWRGCVSATDVYYTSGPALPFPWSKSCLACPSRTRTPSPIPQASPHVHLCVGRQAGSALDLGERSAQCLVYSLYCAYLCGWWKGFQHQLHVSDLTLDEDPVLDELLDLLQLFTLKHDLHTRQTSEHMCADGFLSCISVDARCRGHERVLQRCGVRRFRPAFNSHCP